MYFSSRHLIKAFSLDTDSYSDQLIGQSSTTPVNTQRFTIIDGTRNHGNKLFDHLDTIEKCNKWSVIYGWYCQRYRNSFVKHNLVAALHLHSSALTCHMHFCLFLYSFYLHMENNTIKQLHQTTLNFLNKSCWWR